MPALRRPSLTTLWRSRLRSSPAPAYRSSPGSVHCGPYGPGAGRRDDGRLQPTGTQAATDAAPGGGATHRGPLRFADDGPMGVLQLRAAAAGGARHETEAFVFVVTVAGVQPGL